VKEIFSSPKRPYRLSDPPNLICCGYRRSFLGVKRPGRDVDHSNPSAADIKNEWSYASYLSACLRDVNNDNCTSVITVSDLTLFLVSFFYVLLTVGTVVAQWLRCCATSRKVAGSIPDGVIGIFHWHNPSNRTMTLGSTQPLTEMSTRSISWG